MCPLRLNMFNDQHAAILATIMWTLSTVPGIAKAVYKEPVLFVPSWAMCFFDLWDNNYPKPLLAISSYFQIIPSIILLLANISLIIFSLRQKKRNLTGRQTPKSNRSSNKTIYFVSILYLLSWIPFSISDAFTRKVALPFTLS